MNKGKVVLSMFVIVVALVLSLGATMAWFTADDAATPATFQAGTVGIDAGDTYSITGGNAGNVNPGDCFVLCWEFENTGTKRIELRTEIDPVWVNEAGDVLSLSTDNVFILPQYESDWVLYVEDGELWAYYLGGPVESGDKVSLCLVVFFDGALTTDSYQGVEFLMRANVDAVQASNNAPSEVWGAAWDIVNAAGYEFNYTLKWPTFDLAKIFCYNGENGGTIIENYGEHYVGIEDRLSLDFDYNDFGMTFNLTERYAKGDDDVERLKSITMVFNSVAYLAGDNHDIKVDHLGLTDIDYEYTITRSSPAFGNETAAGTYQSSDKPLGEVVLYDTAQYSSQTVQMNEQVTINLLLDEPTVLLGVVNPRPGLDVVDLEEGLWYYNFVLENKTEVNTFDMTTISTSNGIGGYKAPFIIVVPKPGFIPPEDQAKIDTVYEDFEKYYKTGTPAEWYNNITDAGKLAW